MDQNSSKYSVYQHNAQWARETHALKVVERLLERVRFPAQRVWVDLRFDYNLSEPAASSVDVIVSDGEAHGVVSLRLQGLFLMQDFQAMIDEAIPHELAHVCHEIDAKVNKFQVQKPHDADWQHFLKQLAPDATPSATIPGEFDDRAVKVLKGGIGVVCSCGGDEGFNVVAESAANAAKLRTRALLCKKCKYPYERSPDTESIPDKVKAEVKYLEEIKCLKLYHEPLKR